MDILHLFGCVSWQGISARLLPGYQKEATLYCLHDLSSTSSWCTREDQCLSPMASNEFCMARNSCAAHTLTITAPQAPLDRLLRFSLPQASCSHLGYSVGPSKLLSESWIPSPGTGVDGPKDIWTDNSHIEWCEYMSHTVIWKSSDLHTVTFAGAEWSRQHLIHSK